MKRGLFVFLLIICNGIAWQQVIANMKPTPPAFYFFDVGQGDSELIDFGRVQILIDGGPPNGKALKELEKVLKPEDRSIDIVILTHPHLDHFGGLPDIASRYNIRKFITNGTISKASAYKSVPKPDIILGEGDNIRYGNYTISILGPNATERTDSDPNKTSLVLILEGPDTRIFYAGDMQAENEERIRKQYKLKADILKVAHHGSRLSSSNLFLKELKPKIAVIEVGKNSYNHPAPAVRARIETTKAHIYETLKRGSIKIVPHNRQLKIYTEK